MINYMYQQHAVWAYTEDEQVEKYKDNMEQKTKQIAERPHNALGVFELSCKIFTLPAHA